jgi:hypothetical protein
VILSFKAKIEIIGVNPYVLLPDEVLNEIFRQSDKYKGTIPVRGTLNGSEFIQTLVKYSGKWRLYLNTPMRKSTETDVGDTVQIEIEYDSRPRTIPMHPKLEKVLNENPDAKQVFDKLSASRQNKIIRYISFLKTEVAIEHNLKRVIRFLNGNDRFVGRDKP